MSKYFQGLNYSLANEDTWVEYDLLPRNVKAVFSVCGSGSRVLPLIAKEPEELMVVDLSWAQLALCRLRIEAARALSWEEYLFFLGYRKSGPSKRADLMAKLKLPPDDQALWKEIQTSWEDNGFIYLGKWENHFMKLGKLFGRIPGIDVAPLFAAESFEKQREILSKHWHPNVFRLFTKIVLNEWVSNKLLYKGSFAGGKERRTSERSASELVFEEFSDLFQNTWVRSNYFLNMIFLGQVNYEEAYPLEALEEVWLGVKSSKTQITYSTGNLLAHIKEKSYDFYSLSDTFSYMNTEELENFLPSLPPSVSSGSQMIIRTFMRKPQFPISSPWQTEEEKNLACAKKDCTRVYEFLVLRKA